jgi:hypothetical protein
MILLNDDEALVLAVFAKIYAPTPRSFPLG